LIQNGDWLAIRKLAQQAAALTVKAQAR